MDCELTPGKKQTLLPETQQQGQSVAWIPPEGDLRNVRLQVGHWMMEVQQLAQRSGEPTRVTEVLFRPVGTERKNIDWSEVSTKAVQPKGA